MVASAHLVGVPIVEHRALRLDYWKLRREQARRPTATPLPAAALRHLGQLMTDRSFFWNPKQVGRIHLNNVATGKPLCNRFHEPSRERFTLEMVPAADTEVCATCLGVLGDVLRAASSLSDSLRGKA